MYSSTGSVMKKMNLAIVRAIAGLVAAACADAFLASPSHADPHVTLQMSSSGPSRRDAITVGLAIGLLQGDVRIACAQTVPGMKKPAPKNLRKSQWTGVDDAEQEEEAPAASSAADVRRKEEPVATAAEVTDRIFMDIKIQGVNVASDNKRGSNIGDQIAAEGRVVIGLYGKAAPVTANFFKDLFSGTLAAECQKMNIEAATQREMLQKKQPFKQCKAAEGKPVNLEDSQVWRILEDERIDFGRLKGKFLLRQAPIFDETNALKHDRAGVVSTKKGGGVFEFSGLEKGSLLLF